MKWLSVLVQPSDPDIVIVDVSQLLYRVVWPHGGDVSSLVDSIEHHLKKYQSTAECILVFDKYKGMSAKDHERARRRVEEQVDYHISLSSKLPKRDAVMKNKNNKRQLSAVMATFSIPNTTMETHIDEAYAHDEADITIVSHVSQSAELGKKTIRVLSDDTDVFVLLVYWVWKNQIQSRVHMERWDHTILDINATCANLGDKCGQLLGAHALSGCDTTSYLFGKGKVLAINTLKKGNFQGLHTILGEPNMNQANVFDCGKQFITAIYNAPGSISMEEMRYHVFTKQKKKPKLINLPPTSANLHHHILRSHLQVMLWKAADQKEPHNEANDITKFGWEVKDGMPMPQIAQGNPAPPKLIDVVQCSCQAVGKACSNNTCSCKKNRLSCTLYCKCTNLQCHNPHTKKGEETNTANETSFQHDMEDSENEELEEIENEEIGEVENANLN